MKASSIQFLTYAAIMASVLFIPNLAQELGASRFEIGIIVAFYGLALFLSSYIFGRLSDMHGREIFLRVGLLISAITFFMQIFISSVFILLLVRIFNGISIGIYPAALLSHIHDRKKSIGKFSSYGSLGWAFGAFIAGVIASYQGIFVFSSALFFLAFLISFKLEMKHTPITVPFFPIKVIKKNFSVYSSFLFRDLGAMSIWTIFPLYLTGLGADKFWIGILFVINTGTQFLVMQRIDKFKCETLVYLGLGVSTFVFLFYSFAINYWQVFPLQALLGVSWAFLYTGSLIYLMNRNIEKATSTGIFHSLRGLSGIFGPILGGVIAQIWGFKEVMYFAALLSSIVFFIFLRRYLMELGRDFLSCEIK